MHAYCPIKTNIVKACLLLLEVTRKETKTYGFGSMAAGTWEEKEEGMACRGWIAFLAAVLLLVVGSIAIFPRVGQTADQMSSVMGIVGDVDANVISVEGKTYDLKGVQIRGADGSGPVGVSSLRGKTVEIVFRNRKIDSVTVYRTLPQ